MSSSAAPSRNSANTSGPKASDNTAPPTEEVEEKLSQYSNSIINIALFGVDAVEGGAGRSDSIMIATLDTVNKKLKLTSIMRDSYVAIDGHGNDKINLLMPLVVLS